MKEIIIKESNKDKINEMIREAEGKATVRTIDYTFVVRATRNIEKKFSFAHKKDMEGLEVICDPNAQEYPSAYKYNPQATFFKVRYSKGSWRLMWVERRDQKKNRITENEVIAMPGTLMNAITNHYLSF